MGGATSPLLSQVTLCSIPIDTPLYLILTVTQSMGLRKGGFPRSLSQKSKRKTERSKEREEEEEQGAEKDKWGQAWEGGSKRAKGMKEGDTEAKGRRKEQGERREKRGGESRRRA